MPLPRQPENESLGKRDTPLLPSGYHVHDGTRPQPPVVSVPENAPPSDAKVLFDGHSLAHWTHQDGSPCTWEVENGELVVLPRSGDIVTVESFADCQLHLEFSTPLEIEGPGQKRGNSGVFMMDRYELQVLDNYENLTYADGTVGAVYGQFPPLVNAIRKPGEWNTYDILWKAPAFDGETLLSPAVVTVLLNGVVVQNATALNGPTRNKSILPYQPHGAAPIRLQDHHNPVRFRNIWIRAL